MGGEPRNRKGRRNLNVSPWMAIALVSSMAGRSGYVAAKRCPGFLTPPCGQQQGRKSVGAACSSLNRYSFKRSLSLWAVSGTLPRYDEDGDGQRNLVEPADARLMKPRSSALPVMTTATCSSSSSTLPTTLLRGGGGSTTGRRLLSSAAGVVSPGGHRGGGGRATTTGRGNTQLSSTAAAPVAPPEVHPDGITIIKPDRDTRQYRYLVLPNELEVVLVSDPYTEQAAASMFIRAGHMQDPPELAGMAHFHEHMLFLGTEKYPEEGEFENFLTQHGGSSNAYTATESTNYYFDVKSSHLRGATDRFAQFFRTPLFAESAIEREMQAVDSEHSNNKNEDTWRIYQVLKATANPSHAFSKFGSGNYETLRPRPEEGVDTRASLIDFHETYYSADAMKLSILGNEDLDTLEAWVRDAFSGVRNTKPPAVPDYGPFPAFGAAELGRRVTVIPLKETRQLALSWPLPPTKVHKRSKPTVYVSHLLGYEGEGGLHKLLHGRGWVSSLSAGSMVTGTDFQLFRLSLSLTEEGERHTDEIIELCHRFIALLRSEPPQKRIRDDLAAMREIGFRFLENGGPSRAVQSIATTLGQEDVVPAEVLSGAFTVLEWDPAAITDVVNRLTPRNCQV
ncbi:unnamed protein product, partial [Ectocarpus sp. 4 AP-2014]